MSDLCYSRVSILYTQLYVFRPVSSSCVKFLADLQETVLLFYGFCCISLWLRRESAARDKNALLVIESLGAKPIGDTFIQITLFSVCFVHIYFFVC
jgi:hypothetical protein